MACEHEHIIVETVETLGQYYDGPRDEWGDYVDSPMPQYVLSAWCSDCQADVAALYADQLGIKIATPELARFFQ